MPSLTFVLPHWLFWIGLILFPIAAMIIVRRQRQRTGPRPALTLAVAYLLWLGGGFVGLHRFYVRSAWGLIFIPLFVAVLYGNVEHRDARNADSNTQNNVTSLEFLVERYTKQAAEGGTGAESQVEATKKELEDARRDLVVTTETLDYWFNFSRALAAAIAVLLIIDAALLPRYVRRCNAREGPAPPPAPMHGADVAGTQEDPTLKIRSRATDVVDAISGWTGEFVSFWSVIAVFVYYYEVLARYVFNSPTNWAHEAMFLTFGMQYLIAGAYALREDAHVRVDVVYLLLPDRVKVITDIVTSVFFFIFTVTLMVTGWIFFTDSFQVLEVSFTEWGIQYYPVKAMMAVGAFFIVLQGLAKLYKDIILLKRGRA